MDAEQVRALAQIMQESGLTEIVWRQGDARLVLRRALAGAQPVPSAPLPATTAPAAVPPSPAPAAPAPGDAAVAALVEIKSPMVGTFYAAPEPDAPPFVKVGSEVGPESVVCIVEAMKVFNEIKAETAGVIERVLVQSGHPVEFGQPLFLVRRHT